MANNFWVCPSKNKEVFYDVDKLINFLKKNIKDYQFVKLRTDQFTTIKVYDMASKSNDLFNFWCYNESPIGDRKEIVEYADSNFGEDSGDKIIAFLEDSNFDFSRCIEFRHELGKVWEDQRYITKMIQWYFGAIWLDEGIYPEVILPPKEKPSKSGLIKKFFQFLKVEKYTRI